LSQLNSFDSLQIRFFDFLHINIPFESYYYNNNKEYYEYNWNCYPADWVSVWRFVCSYILGRLRWILLLNYLNRHISINCLLLLNYWNIRNIDTFLLVSLSRLACDCNRSISTSGYHSISNDALLLPCSISSTQALWNI
jgi:hypothetical protein